MSNATTTASAAPAADIAYLFFSSMLVMILFARVVSYFFYRLGIPRIVGDIVAGCLMGPTILQSTTVNIYNPSNQNIVHTVGYLGLIMASITSGANFNPKVLEGQLFKVLAFSVVNIGFSVAAFYGAYHTLPDISTSSAFVGVKYDPVAYPLYFACAFAATSLPMTFLILDELNMHNDLAKFCIGTSTCATVLLFSLVSIAQAYAEADPSKALSEPSQVIPFRIGILALMFVVLYGLKRGWEYGLEKYSSPTSWFHRTSTDQSLVIIALGLTFAVAADRTGYTFILGAFLLGAFLPIDLVAKDGRPASHIRTDFSKLIKWFARWVLLPMFFLDIGLKLDLRYINEYWGHVVAILAWGYLAKFSTVLFARYALSFSWNDAWFAGWLANCRGFNALVVASEANIDQQFGPVAFSVGVLFSVTSSAVAGFMCKYFRQREIDRLALLGEANLHGHVDPQFEIRPFWKDDPAGPAAHAEPLALQSQSNDVDHTHVTHEMLEIQNGAPGSQLRVPVRSGSGVQLSSSAHPSPMPEEHEHEHEHDHEHDIENMNVGVGVVVGPVSNDLIENVVDQLPRDRAVSQSVVRVHHPT